MVSLRNSGASTCQWCQYVSVVSEEVNGVRRYQFVSVVSVYVSDISRFQWCQQVSVVSVMSVRVSDVSA